MRKVLLLAAAVVVVGIGVSRLKRDGGQAPPPAQGPSSAAPGQAPAAGGGEASSRAQAPSRYRAPITEPELAGFVQGVEERLAKILAPVEERLRRQVARRASCLRDTTHASLTASKEVSPEAKVLLDDARKLEALCASGGRAPARGETDTVYAYINALRTGQGTREACLAALARDSGRAEELRKLPEPGQRRLCDALSKAYLGTEPDPCPVFASYYDASERAQAARMCRQETLPLRGRQACESGEKDPTRRMHCVAFARAIEALRAKDPELCQGNARCLAAIGAKACSTGLVQEARDRAVRAHCDYVADKAATVGRADSGALAEGALKELYTLASDYRKFYEEYRQRKPSPPVPPRFEDILEARKKIQKLVPS